MRGGMLGPGPGTLAAARWWPCDGRSRTDRGGPGRQGPGAAARVPGRCDSDTDPLDSEAVSARGPRPSPVRAHRDPPPDSEIRASPVRVAGGLTGTRSAESSRCDSDALLTTRTIMHPARERREIGIILSTGEMWIAIIAIHATRWRPSVPAGHVRVPPGPTVTRFPTRRFGRRPSESISRLKAVVLGCSAGDSDNH